MRVVCTDSIFGEIQTKLSTKYYTTTTPNYRGEGKAEQTPRYEEYGY